VLRSEERIMKVNVTIGIPVWLDKMCAWPVMFYRRRKYGCPFRKIPLGEGRFTIVEPGDFYRLNNFHWYVSGKGECFYATRATRTEAGKSKTVYLHREIMSPPEGLLVDHKNGYSLDNRRANLRLATQSQNMQNRRKRKNATSQFLGVHFDKKRSLWTVAIFFEGKSVFLGRFENEIDAAKAYDAAAKKYYGEFARLNFPQKDMRLEPVLRKL
jgi:hypothetical protein